MQAKCSNKEFTQPQGEHFPSKVFTFAPTGLSGPKLATLARTLEKLALRGHGRPYQQEPNRICLERRPLSGARI